MDKKQLLSKPLPVWAVKPHPTKTNMSAIHPMAVIDRLNEVFGVGKWHFMTREISEAEFIQKTKNGQRDMFRATAHVTLTVPDEDIHIEQFGGSSNDDLGDAYKGAATDGLTKCASYLGIGASIYKNMGNVAPPVELSLDDVMKRLGGVTSVAELEKEYKSLSPQMRQDEEVIAKCKEVKAGLEEI